MILVCTLGTTWAVIPEVLGFLAPSRIPLLRNHPRRIQLDQVLEKNGLSEPGEVRVVTTGGKETAAPVEKLRSWWRLTCPDLPLRILLLEGPGESDDAVECRRMRELIFRAVLASTSTMQPVTLSLAGGRKTMSADLQLAGSLFGCRALVHVITPVQLPDELSKPTPESFSLALSAGTAGFVTPVLIGSGYRREFLDVDRLGKGPVVTEAFPLPLPEPDGTPCPFSPGDEGPWLADEITVREEEASRLLGNYIASISLQEMHENWRSLYRLPPAVIEKLRKTVLGPADRPFINSLPKADLHLHLGGCLSLASQKRVGEMVVSCLGPREKDAVRGLLGELLDEAAWSLDLKSRLRKAPNPGALAALLLSELGLEDLEKRLFSLSEPRRALKERGFSWYELPGELAGSTLLSHEAAIEPYATEALREARATGCRYIELRGSPNKYLGGDGKRFLRLFHRALERARTDFPDVTVRFNVIADRRDEERIEGIIEMALGTREELGDFVSGIDLAGDEQRGNPEELAPRFHTAFERCIPVTIHAGEGERADNIWKAAYHLHADRIGHGLTLAERPQLAERFRERRICLEMCPTSNLEVVGFRDPADEHTHHHAPYPLRQLLDMGLLVTLCTDNPGISRTALTDEFVTASRLSGGLTLWNALTLIKHGFEYSFLGTNERGRLMKEADARIFEILSLQHTRGE